MKLLNDLEFLLKIIDEEIEDFKPSLHNEYVRAFDKGYRKCLIEHKEIVEMLLNMAKDKNNK